MRKEKRRKRNAQPKLALESFDRKPDPVSLHSSPIALSLYSKLILKMMENGGMELEWLEGLQIHPLFKGKTQKKIAKIA